MMFLNLINRSTVHKMHIGVSAIFESILYGLIAIDACFDLLDATFKIHFVLLDENHQILRRIIRADALC